MLVLPDRLPELTTKRHPGADRWLVLLAIAMLLPLVAADTGILATSVAISPERWESGEVQWLPRCPHAIAGDPCMTCGMTRGFSSMARGQVARAWRYNHTAPFAWASAVLADLFFLWVGWYLVGCRHASAPAPG